MHKTAELYYQNLGERLTNYRDVIYRKYDENKDMPQLARISEAESSVIERVLEIIEDVYDETWEETKEVKRARAEFKIQQKIQAKKKTNVVDRIGVSSISGDVFIPQGKPNIEWYGKE